MFDFGQNIRSISDVAFNQFSSHSEFDLSQTSIKFSIVTKTLKFDKNKTTLKSFDHFRHHSDVVIASKFDQSFR